MGACSRSPTILLRCVNICGLKRAHWKPGADLHAFFVWWWYIYIMHFTNPITVLVLEVLALFFGEEYV